MRRLRIARAWASLVRRSIASIAALAFACVALGLAADAFAAPPTPMTPDLFSFPGSVSNPASASSAGLALADRWLGDEPFANPAIRSGWRVALSPSLVHVDRQDLASHNRNFSQTSAFLDGAGLSVGLPPFGPLAIAGYAYQPLLRFEETAYTRGLTTPDPLAPPAAVQTRARVRELHAGLALATVAGPARAGLGIEWVKREDDYRTISQGGAPDDGTKQAKFSGDGFAFQVGASLDHGDSTAGAFSVGAAARFLPALTMKGVHSENLTVGASEDSIHVERASGWEAGVSARVALGPSFRALAALGSRSAQRWDGFDVRAGSGWEWKIVGEFHDRRDPWSLRFGGGQERQSGAPEPSAGVLSVGLGWRFEPGTLDLGLLRRTLAREGLPNSFDDRVVLTIIVPR